MSLVFKLFLRRAGAGARVLLAGVLLLPAAGARAQAEPDAAAKAADDARRLKAVAEFTQKMKEANYPPLFEKAAAEFQVPPDVLKAVSFAETRWSQLEWPPGETESPDNGMPHAYGIMSLMDNPYLGHSLIEAAKLIGQDPETLKTDVYQNMRGGAALLRKLYDSTPKPADAPGDEIESWRKAIAKYTGIPQPELNEAHALRVYEFMNKGYHQYGIEWDAHPVNLGPMREEVAKIRAAAQARALSRAKAEEAKQNVPGRPAMTASGKSPAPSAANAAATAPLAAESPAAEHAASGKQRKWLLGLIIGLLVIGAVYIFARRKKSA